MVEYCWITQWELHSKAKVIITVVRKNIYSNSVVSDEKIQKCSRKCKCLKKILFNHWFKHPISEKKNMLCRLYFFSHKKMQIFEKKKAKKHSIFAILECVSKKKKKIHSVKDILRKFKEQRTNGIHISLSHFRTSRVICASNLKVLFRWKMKKKRKAKKKKKDEYSRMHARNFQLFQLKWYTSKRA